MTECRTCDGSGYIWDDGAEYADVCPDCGGRGWEDNGDDDQTAVREPDSLGGD